MTPTLVTAPTQPVVSLFDLRAYLRVDHDDDDALIAALERAAVAHLDGWTGVLGRCIMPQTWEISVAEGVHTLPFPDVTSATAIVDGVSESIEVVITPAGPQVELQSAAIVRFTCSMPDTLLPAAQVAVKLWVAEAYENRDGNAAWSGVALRAIVSALRWHGA